MSLARRTALISLVIWTIILIVLIAVLVIVGPERFSDPDYSAYRTLSSAILLPGYALNTWILWRQRRGIRAGEMDERDERIARRASEVTLIIVTVILFIVCVTLWKVYEGSSATAGWFYILAYLTVVLLSLVHAAARLACDSMGSADG